MNHMQLKTPEERKAMAKKGHETRRANARAREAARQEKINHLDELYQKIEAGKKQLDEIDRHKVFSKISRKLTDKSVLTQADIFQASANWEPICGVYFLLNGEEVVYVGQSVNLFSRIQQHTYKDFNRYAYILCEQSCLDVMESLYIHVFRPRLNGRQADNSMCAPMTLQELVKKAGTASLA